MLIELPNSFGDAATNMAVDTSLLETTPAGIAAFRHYGWIEPAVTFGYTQRFSEIRPLAPEDIMLCRRLTGGGLVDHRNDWTYALVINGELAITRRPATELYLALHQALLKACEKQNEHGHLAPCPRQCNNSTPPSTSPDICFIKPVANDVLNQHGRKIAGAAMKRTRKGLLIQGSVDRSSLSSTFNFTKFQTDFLQEISSHLDLAIGQSDDLRPLFSGTQIKEEKMRFSSEAWLKRR